MNTLAHPVKQDYRAANGVSHDPVCGMTVNPATTPHHADHAGRYYFFCSAKCRDRFLADPARYSALDEVRLTPISAPHAPSKSLWICPMHPQIVRSEPGSCPICGMALEPMVPSGAEAENPEFRDMTRRFWVGLSLSVPLLTMVMAAHVSMSFAAVTASRAAVWVQLVLGSPAVLWCGWPFFQRGWASVARPRTAQSGTSSTSRRSGRGSCGTMARTRTFRDRKST